MPQLQLALDSDLTSALNILEKVHPFVDIVEIGTPLIFREGMHAVRRIREQYPKLTLLADLKIMDAGAEEADIAFLAGVSIVTVMGVTNDATIQGAVDSAGTHRGRIMMDMMQVSDLPERSSQLLEIGCEILCVHTAYDLQASQASPYHELNQLRQQFPTARLAIAGGVTLARLDDIMPCQPDIIIVGGAITRATNPAQSAQQLYERIQAYANN